MHHYKVEVTRDGRWWMININEIDDMARSLIAISTDTPLADITIDIIGITVPGIGDIASKAHDLIFERDQAANATKKAQQHAAEFVHQLTTAGIPVRDSGELLGMSPQRISQLAH
jgi:hypothetical protein